MTAPMVGRSKVLKIELVGIVIRKT